MTAEQEKELKILASGYGKLKQQNEVLTLKHKYALEIIDTLKRQVILANKSYLELLEEIVEDLQHCMDYPAKLTVSNTWENYEKRLNKSQKRS